METMNIALPESMKNYVQARVIEGGYESASEYVRNLILADHESKAQERLEALLLEGLDSGMSGPITAEFWEERKRKLTESLDRDAIQKS